MVWDVAGNGSSNTTARCPTPLNNGHLWCACKGLRAEVRTVCALSARARTDCIGGDPCHAPVGGIS